MCVLQKCLMLPSFSKKGPHREGAWTSARCFPGCVPFQGTQLLHLDLLLLETSKWKIDRRNPEYSIKMFLKEGGGDIAHSFKCLD